VPVDPVHARTRVIHVLPGATVQPGFHNLFFLPMEGLVALGQQMRDLAIGNQDSHVGKPFADLRLGHMAQMREHHTTSSPSAHTRRGSPPAAAPDIMQGVLLLRVWL